MDDQTIQTQYVDHERGRIAYEVVGDGPLVVLSPGVADIRSTYRFLAPLIADAGYRVASVDLRGHGGSSTGWDSYSYPDTAGDLIQVIRKLGGPGGDCGPFFLRRSDDDRGRDALGSGERDRGDQPVYPAPEVRRPRSEGDLPRARQLATTAAATASAYGCGALTKRAAALLATI